MFFLSGIWARVAPYLILAGAVVAVLFGVYRKGERAATDAIQAKTLRKTTEAQDAMLKAAANRPRDRDELVGRMRDGSF